MQQAPRYLYLYLCLRRGYWPALPAVRQMTHLFCYYSLLPKAALVRECHYP